jgi:hypothetical protein
MALALGLALGMSGCTLLTPQDTLHMQETSNGVGGSVGHIDVRNAVIISNSKGSVGNLVVTLVNNDDKAHYVSIVHGSTTKSVGIPALGVKKLGSDEGKRVQFAPLGAKPGSLTDVYFTYSGATGTQLQVPVLKSTFPGFEGYAPGK